MIRGMTVRRLLVLFAACGSLTACNWITGAAGLEAGDPAEDDTSGPGAGPGPVGAGGSMGVGAGSSVGGGAGVGGAGVGGDPDPPVEMSPVDGVTMSRIAIYQSVERLLMEGGNSASSTAPVVAGRPALLRVFYSVDGGYNGQPVVARLTIGSGQPIEMQTTLSGSSSAGNLGSTLNFDVDPALLTPGAGYRVELLQASELTSGGNTGAIYPSSGQADLDVEVGGGLKVTLVPIQYNGDGSGRMPDTSAGQLKAYEDLFFAMYPITDVQISVRQAFNWSQSVQAGGNGWNNLLNAIADLRQNDNAPFDEYYYGIFNPADSFNSYCSGGCVTGLGFVGGPSDDSSHAAIGVGFSGGTSVDTAVHEVGHNHGRPHAPCGNVSGADGSYPYSNATLGVWGFNLLSGQLYGPNDYRDMMSYCDPPWISDYQYDKIFERVQFTNNASIQVPPSMQNLTWDRVELGPNGTTTPMSAITMHHP
ncbi:MAG: hypothetical protein KC731_19600, partial [Myxococcales bacterium]|nr:hypothetical protein [Myxococcales bacterium]